jgi:hypothetical protein
MKAVSDSPKGNPAFRPPEFVPLKSSSESPRMSAPERGLSRRASSQQGGKTLRGIAMKQLSQNLTRQDSMKPTNQSTDVPAIAAGGVSGFRSRRPNLSMNLIDGSSESFATVEKDDHKAHVTFLPAIKEASPTPKAVHEHVSFGSQQLAEPSKAAQPASTAATAPAKKGKRPMLQLQLSENDASDAATAPVAAVAPPEPAKVEATVATVATASNGAKPKRKPMLQLAESDAADVEANVAERVDQQYSNQASQFSGRGAEPSPRGAETPNRPTISPRGTFLLGDIRINSEGIKTQADQQRSRGVSDAPVMRGMDFLEVRPLGNGASGVVMEANHVPTLTIVALKMLPIYSQEKCENLTRELVILHKNLAALSLVDNSLSEDSNNNNGSSQKCPNLLSLFNAFVNAKNGMVCMVMEYMDGGSLDDLVKNGGCNDEYVLSDIARQGLTGLAFLHRNKSVHRDIKPANILCSSSGIVKIADFGISKVMDGATGFAKTFVGTVIYMSP